MNKKLWTILILTALTLTLTACGPMSLQPTLAAGEEARVQGGGGGGPVSLSSQSAEGLVVVGTGTASAEPEVANIVFGLELRGDDPAAIVDEAAQRINRAIAAAKEAGVAEADIRTTGYNLWVETVHDPEKGVPTGEVVYHLSHYVKATLHDLDRVGELLGTVVDAGANTISEVSFAVEDPETLVEQARQQALNKAAARAQQMADALKITLGEPILVTETGGGYPVPTEWGVGGGGAMVESVAPSISPGTFSVSVSVQIVYGIR